MKRLLAVAGSVALCSLGCDAIRYSYSQRTTSHGQTEMIRIDRFNGETAVLRRIDGADSWFRAEGTDEPAAPAVPATAQRQEMQLGAAYFSEVLTTGTATGCSPYGGGGTLVLNIENKGVRELTEITLDVDVPSQNGRASMHHTVSLRNTYMYELGLKPGESRRIEERLDNCSGPEVRWRILEGKGYAPGA